MKRRFVFALLAALLVAPSAQAAENWAYRLAAILSGTFRGSTPGNELTLDTQSFTTDPNHPYDLFVRVFGKYQDDNVRIQGVMRFEVAGKDVLVTYVPHFDPSTTVSSPDADRFTDSEAAAACTINFKQRGDGFVGETLGSSCNTAIRGARSKWTVEVEPGSLRLRDVASGETLRFKKTTK